MREGRRETKEEKGNEANRKKTRRRETRAEWEKATHIPGLGVNEGRGSKDKGREKWKDGPPSP